MGIGKICLFFSEGQIPFFRAKWSGLSEFVKDVKLGFTRFYNKRHHRRGFLWGDRFKSVIVENGETPINCLAYLDLNPVRAGIVEKPEDYRWNSLTSDTMFYFLADEKYMGGKPGIIASLHTWTKTLLVHPNGVGFDFGY